MQTKRRHRKIGDKVRVIGIGEHQGKLFSAKIIDFDRMCILVREENGNEYWLNEWNLKK